MADSCEKKELKESLRDMILSRGLKKREENDQASFNAAGEPMQFYFDLRGLFLDSDFQKKAAVYFWRQFSSSGYQVGGLETAAIPLVSSLVYAAQDTNGFYIRKKRKRYATQKYIEGEVSSKKIVLVDDLILSGKSFLKQVQVLEKAGYVVDSVFCFVRFYEVSYYQELEARGITIHSVFDLSDFGLPKVKSPERSYFKVSKNIAQSLVKQGDLRPEAVRPVVSYGDSYYVAGSDGTIAAYDIKNYRQMWKRFLARPNRQGRTIFSEVVVDSAVLAIATNQKIFILEKESGSLLQVFNAKNSGLVAPILLSKSEESLLVCVSQEYRDGRYQDTVIGYNLETEQCKYRHSLTSSVSELIMSLDGQACFVVSDSFVYKLDVSSDKKLWQFDCTTTIQTVRPISEQTVVVTEKQCFLLDQAGRKEWRIEYTDVTFTAVNEKGGVIYLSTNEGWLFALSRQTGELVWELLLQGSVSGPVEFCGGAVFAGTDEGYVYVLKRSTGRRVDMVTLPEKVVTSPHIQRNKLLVLLANEQLVIYNNFIVSDVGVRQ